MLGGAACLRPRRQYSRTSFLVLTGEKPSARSQENVDLGTGFTLMAWVRRDRVPPAMDVSLFSAGTVTPL
jgi:hypothetical protein